MATTQKETQIEVFPQSEDVFEPRIVRRRGQRDRITASFKKRSTFRWVLTDQLKIDPDYQRKVRMQKVIKMAHNWNPDKAGALVVSRRNNGTYYVIDGQHRLIALLLIDNRPPRIYCEVFSGLTKEEEARLFHDLDSERDNLTPGASFKALAASGDEAARNIIAVAKNVGLSINYDRGPHPGNVRAFKTIQAIYRRQGDVGLQRILGICSKAWPEHKDATSHSILLGLEIFLDKYGNDISDRRLVEVLSKYDPAYIVNSGRAINGTISSTIYPSIAIAIRQVYNKRLKRDRLPEGI